MDKKEWYLDAYKLYRIFEFTVLALMVFCAVTLTHHVSPIITGDVLLEESMLLSRSQMSAWIMWMNTLFIFGIGYCAIRMVGKWLRPKERN